MLTNVNIYAIVSLKAGHGLQKYLVNIIPKKRKVTIMSYLQLVEDLMDRYGLDEDTACREASAILHPETDDADDYDGLEVIA